MLNPLLLAIRFLILVLSDHKQVALENIALRHQLAVFTREKKRPRLRDRDRLFWITLQRLWKDWRSALVFVQPETVTGWQRKRFKRYWWRLSQSKGPISLSLLHFYRNKNSPRKTAQHLPIPSQFRTFDVLTTHSKGMDEVKGRAYPTAL